jgi:putative nucleotidyltransferase with HDIG domain
LNFQLSLWCLKDKIAVVSQLNPKDNLDTIGGDKSDHYIDRVTHLPPAPTVATELLGLFNDPDRDIDRIIELISHDPSLTIEVLKRCNSAALSGEVIAADMFEAVTRLGFYEVYCVVAGTVGARAMSIGKAQGGLDAVGLWRHSVTTAVAAATLAKRVREVEAVAFTAGLLHDIGKLVFTSVESARYADLVKQTGTFGPNLAAAEQSVFGVSHAHIGARLLARWGLPENVAVGTLLHHGSPKVSESFEQLAATVHLANGLAHQMVKQAPYATDLLLSSSDSMTLLKLTPEDIPTLIAQTQKDLQRVQGLLQMIT